VLKLDRQALLNRVNQKFGGSIAAVARAWPEDDQPHRGTISRWIKGNKLPRSAHGLLSLSAVLDIDPIALLKVVAPFPRLLARLVETSRAGSWASLEPALSFLAPFIGPTRDWPPLEVANKYFHRSWVTRDFEHAAATNRRNYFAAILIEPDGGRGQFDQVLHFAWRDRIDQAVWRPYGFVRLAGPNVRLFSFNGLVGTATMGTAEVPSFYVETWFGEGAAVFRVASLHGFHLTVAEAVDGSKPVVRFGFP